MKKYLKKTAISTKIERGYFLGLNKTSSFAYFEKEKMVFDVTTQIRIPDQVSIIFSFKKKDLLTTSIVALASRFGHKKVQTTTYYVSTLFLGHP